MIRLTARERRAVKAQSMPKPKKKPKAIKGWALCHHGKPLVIYTEWTRHQVQAECQSWHTVVRVGITIPVKSPKGAK